LILSTTGAASVICDDRPNPMHIALPTLFLVSCMTIACCGGPAEAIDAAGGQKIVKDFYADGAIKTLTRLYPDGRVVGTLYHSTNGTPTHFDYYDNQKRVRRTLLYRADGTAHTSQEFDDQHRLTMETRFDAKGETTSGSFYLLAGRVVIQSPGAWQIISHKLDASQDVVGFQIPNTADEGTPDSANVGVVVYDLSLATNATAFAQRRRESGGRAPKPSHSGGWVIHTFHDKQGDTAYEIRDTYRTLGQRFGVHIRLAFPDLSKTTRSWRQSLEADFKKLLETTETRETK
jgi:hypothetical protein